MEKNDIIKAVMEKEYQISPEAVELIKSNNSPEALLGYVLSIVDDSIIVIETEHIDLEGFAAHPYSEAVEVENEENSDLDFSAGNLSSNFQVQEKREF